MLKTEVVEKKEDLWEKAKRLFKGFEIRPIRKTSF